MTRRLTLFLVGGAVAAVVSAGSVVVAGDPISEKIERERKTLEQLKDKIEEKRKRADEAEKKRESVLQGIQTLDERLMLTRIPGVFCAGEMLDWEAPTGGYLLTACFASGYVAGTGAAGWLMPRTPTKAQKAKPRRAR